jgi:DNA polymerase-3 subunit beta
VRAVATDGHRLAFRDAAPAGAAGIPGIIVPRKAVGELRKLPTSDDRVGRPPDAEIASPARESVLTAKLIDGTFPDAARHPDRRDRVMEVPKREFARPSSRLHDLQRSRGP